MLADVRVVRALGGFAAGAVTAVTAQNSRGVRAWRPVPPALIRAQIEAVFEDLPVTAVKVGLLPGPAAEAVARALGGRRVPIVVDPVLGSTSGARFISAAGRGMLLEHLLPMATLATPNWPEAAELTGLKVASAVEAEAAGRALLSRGCQAVLVKGGHAPGMRLVDVLVTPGGTRRLSGRRIETGNTRGTGCALSTAIACALGRGAALPEAVASARRFLLRHLRRNRHLRLGSRAGPSIA